MLGNRQITFSSFDLSAISQAYSDSHRSPGVCSQYSGAETKGKMRILQQQMSVLCRPDETDERIGRIFPLENTNRKKGLTLTYGHFS